MGSAERIREVARLTASCEGPKLVVLSGPVRPAEEISRTIDIVAGLSLEHSEVICCVFVSADDFERGESPLLMNVRREGVAV